LVNHFKKICISLFIFAFSFCSYAQFKVFKSDSTILCKNEIGVDFANILTFLNRNSQSYLLNYKRYINSKLGLRLGLNLNISSFKVDGNTFDTRLGLEYGKQLDKFRIFYGSDISYQFNKTNFQQKYFFRIGAEPFVGGKYYFNKYFSISTEAKLNFHYYHYTDPTSFDKDANGGNTVIFIGSIGMILLNYHF
jgi:hypothetical protein